jgi:hypothetical protein
MRIGGQFDYAEHPTLTAVGALARQWLKNAPDVALSRTSADRVLSDLPEWDPKNVKAEFYYWFWGTAFMSGYGGSHRIKWEEKMRGVLRAKQCVSGGLCDYGSWPPGDKWTQ